MAFFGTLELMSDEFNIYNPGVSTFSWSFLKKNLQLSRRKITTIYSFFDQKAKENLGKNKGFLVSMNDEGVTINCKRLAELSDNHTQKLLREKDEGKTK